VPGSDARALNAARAALVWAPTAAWGAVIWWLSSQPSPRSPLDVPDYMAHAMEYGLLGTLAWASMAGSGLPRSPRTRALMVIGICALFGASDEYHQSFVPGRDSSLGDLAADTVGASLAAAGMWLITAAIGLLAERRAGRLPLLTLLTRRECHLCEDAEAVLRQVQSEVPFRYEKIDIDSDRGLLELYGDQVPVVLIGERKIFKYRVDPDRLRRRLLGTR